MSGGSVWRITGKRKKTHESKNFSYRLSQLFLKYAKTLDILIYQFVHMEFSANSLMIFLNFCKAILPINLIKVYCDKMFFEV